MNEEIPPQRPTHINITTFGGEILQTIEVPPLERVEADHYTDTTDDAPPSGERK